jgi:hypothetical protein
MDVMRLPIAAFLFLGSSLGAMPPDWDWFGGAQMQASFGLASRRPSLGEDLNGHLGLGIAFHLGVRASERNAFRLNLDYAGNEVATWYYTYPNLADRIEYKDIWRTLRLGVEHEISLDHDRRFYVLYGGGVQESWVNRTEGSLLEVTLLAVIWSQGTVSGSARYSTKSTALDTFQPYANAGLGWDLKHWGRLELRYSVSPYERYRATGLRTDIEGTRERALGHRISLGWGVRLGD